MAKKKNNVLLIGLILILVLAIGLSYGYYLLSKVQENNNIAGSKCFNLEFTNEKNAINLDNMYPISDEEGRKLTPYSFTITNTCDMLDGYTVNMEMLEGTTLNSKYLDVMINNEEIKLLTNYESTNTVIAGSTESRILAKGTLAYNDSVDYTVRFWMDKDVEDTESMNKLFKSKIVISATPSSWNPKDAGYDTLHDAILANEYQTTPTDAISKIEAKGTPDLSHTAPIVKWIEKTGETTTRQVRKPTTESINSVSELNGLNANEQFMYICTSKSFDGDTSLYYLNNCDFKDPTTLDYSGDKKYYYSVENLSFDLSTSTIYVARNTSATIVYQIIGASKSIENQSMYNVDYEVNKYELQCITLSESELETDKSDKGLYQTTDDYGITYYYRGNIKNNNVYFAGYYWQIVRVNGDGTIRILYNGTEKNATGINQSINNINYYFNSKLDNPSYVGYMYGNVYANTFDEVHANRTSSDAKNNIDIWYESNILKNNFNKYISNESGFCGDRTIYDGGNGIQVDKTTYFGAYGKYFSGKYGFKCANIERDLYTVSNATIGNKALKYPIGLITYDEMVYAGLNYVEINRLSWIYSTNTFWSISPSLFFNSDKQALVFTQDNGKINGWGTSLSLGLRPVINLKSDVKITGGIGTSNDPFVIDTSK